MGWNSLSFLKLQQHSCWSLCLDKEFHLTLYGEFDHLSMLGLKLIHVSQSGTWSAACVFKGLIMVGCVLLASTPEYVILLHWVMTNILGPLGQYHGYWYPCSFLYQDKSSLSWEFQSYFISSMMSLWVSSNKIIFVLWLGVTLTFQVFLGWCQYKLCNALWHENS